MTTKSSVRGLLYTLPLHRPFAETLVRGIWRDCAESLAEVRIFLPSQRACKSVEAMFLRCAEEDRAAQTCATILPRLIPLGAVEQAEDEWEWESEADEELDRSAKRKITNFERRLLFITLIERWQRAQRSSTTAAIALADALARLGDEMIFDEVAPGALLAEGLVPENCAEHWRESLAFLKILTEHWPNILREKGLYDASRSRIEALDAVSRSLVRSPPSDPVIVAGSTGSVKATARLMEAVLSCERGQVILPGCPPSFRNLEEDDSYRDSLSTPTHPFHAFAQFFFERPHLAERLRRYPFSSEPEQASQIRKYTLLETAMTPQPSAPSEPHSARPPLIRIDCSDGEEEAEIIALLMRESLDQPHKRTALVTRDRTLARRVRLALLRRWGILVEDTATRSLSESPAAKLFLSLLHALAPSTAEGSDDTQQHFPLDFTALQGAFYALGGEGALSPVAHAFCRFDARVLRSPHRRGRRQTLLAAHDLDKLRTTLLAQPSPLTAEERALLERALAALLPFATCLAQGSSRSKLQGSSRSKLLETHIESAESFAKILTPPEQGKSALYSARDGAHLQNFCSALKAYWSQESERTPCAPYAYRLLLEGLITAETLPGLHPSHPRLSILGPLEARLLSFDRIILGGLNEGKWPPQCDGGPFLPRETRKKLGLRDAETRIGLSALDFLSFGAAAQELYLTRAERQQGQPQMPSRFLQRLQALGDFEDSERANTLRLWAEALAQAAPTLEVQAPRPAPRASPPREQRPNRISLTQLSKLLLDPYGFYALYVLKLRALESLAIEGEESLRGQFFHKVFESLPDLFPESKNAAALESALCERAEPLLRDFAPLSSMRHYWRIELAHNARHLARRLFALQPQRLWSECTGEARLKMSSDKEITITARADLIVEDRQGQYFVIDYKSGASSIPPQNQICRFHAPQLLFEGWMLMRGAFPSVPKSRGAPRGIYWLFQGRQYESPSLTIDEDFVHRNSRHLSDCDSLQQLYENCVEFYRKMLDQYEDERQDYEALPLSEREQHYDPYRHLARRQEWGDETQEDSARNDAANS